MIKLLVTGIFPSIYIPLVTYEDGEGRSVESGRGMEWGKGKLRWEREGFQRNSLVE